MNLASVTTAIITEVTSSLKQEIFQKKLRVCTVQLLKLTIDALYSLSLLPLQFSTILTATYNVLHLLS